MSHTTTNNVLRRHLKVFGNNDLEEIMKNYTEESLLFTPTDMLQGIAAIQQFFANYFLAIATGSSFEMKQLQVKDNIAYISGSSN